MKSLLAAILLFSSVSFAIGLNLPVTRITKTEDRGDVVVTTITTQQAVAADLLCTTVTVIVVDKATEETLSSNTEHSCLKL